jgi:hypothetical protein
MNQYSNGFVFIISLTLFAGTVIAFPRNPEKNFSNPY